MERVLLSAQRLQAQIETAERSEADPEGRGDLHQVVLLVEDVCLSIERACHALSLLEAADMLASARTRLSAGQRQLDQDEYPALDSERRHWLRQQLAALGSQLNGRIDRIRERILEAEKNTLPV